MDDPKVAAADQLDLRTAELLQALTLYDRSKARFVERRITLDRRYPDRAAFLIGARDDVPYKEAIADCAWYSSEVRTLGTAVLALAAVTR